MSDLIWDPVDGLNVSAHLNRGSISEGEYVPI
jgi:hypothetical protein